MLNVSNISKSFSTRMILSEISFSLATGQKVALVGYNGTGKTTILKLLAGEIEPDSGSIDIPAGTLVGYLKQDTSLFDDISVKDYLRKVTTIENLEQEMENLIPLLDQSESLNKYGELQEQYERLGGYDFDHKIELILTGFGLDTLPLDQKIPSLSSGQKSKIALAGILLKGVDLLLLDEPTNNLDLPALIWLEDFLKRTAATCLIVSHDKLFLDRIVRKIFELDWNTHTLHITNGTYSDYIEHSQRNRNRQKEAYELQQEEIARLQKEAKEQRIDAARGSKWVGSDNDKFLRGFKRDRAGSSSKKAKVIEKRIEQMDKIERVIERDPLVIDLPLEQISPDKISIKLSNVTIGYDDKFILGPISFEASFGERIGILGMNGSGKSTLLKTIAGNIKPLGGTISIGSGVRIGNLMQEHESLPRDSTLLDFLMNKGKLSKTDSYSILARFGFAEEQLNASISTLSPGGRSRLLLAYFVTQQVNVLILDEPTNHLDLEALEALTETMSDYKGTILLVTHDRSFIEQAKLNQVFMISEGNFSFLPDYHLYIKKAEERADKLLRQI